MWYEHLLHLLHLSESPSTVMLFNVVFPDIFNVDINVEGLLKLAIEVGFIIAL